MYCLVTFVSPLESVSKMPKTCPPKPKTHRAIRFSHRSNSWQVNHRYWPALWNNIPPTLARSYAAAGFNIHSQS